MPCLPQYHLATSGTSEVAYHNSFAPSRAFLWVLSTALLSSAWNSAGSDDSVLDVSINSRELGKFMERSMVHTSWASESTPKLARLMGELERGTSITSSTFWRFSGNLDLEFGSGEGNSSNGPEVGDVSSKFGSISVRVSSREWLCQGVTDTRLSLVGPPSSIDKSWDSMACAEGSVRILYC